jgi:hypothetical protein
LAVAVLLDKCFLDVFKLIDESVRCDHAARSYDDAEHCDYRSYNSNRRAYRYLTVKPLTR